MPTETAYVPENTETPVTASEEGSSEVASTPIPNTRDVLREAAEKALTEEADKPAEEGKKIPSVLTGEKPAAPAPEKQGIPKLAAMIRAREQAQKVREEARGESAAITANAMKMQAEAEMALANARRLQQESEAERARLARIRSSPMDTIRELGWNTEDLVHSVVREGTPEWQALQRERAEREALAQRVQKQDEFIERLQKREQEQERAQLENHRTTVYRQFLSLVPEEAALRTLYDEGEICAKGDRVADMYRAKTGQVATLEQIRDYLEYEAGERLAKLRQQSGAAPGKAGTKPKAGNGQRTLTSSTSSERRAQPRPYSELKTAAEQRKALEEAAAEAVRSSA